MNNLFMPKEQENLDLVNLKGGSAEDYDVLVFAKGVALYYLDLIDISPGEVVKPTLIGSLSDRVLSLAFYKGHLYDSRADGKIVKTLDNEVVSIDNDANPKGLYHHFDDIGGEFLYDFSPGRQDICNAFGKDIAIDSKRNIQAMCFDNNSKLWYSEVGGGIVMLDSEGDESKTDMYQGVNVMACHEGEIYCGDEQGFIKTIRTGVDVVKRKSKINDFFSNGVLLLDCSSEGIYDTLNNFRVLENNFGDPDEQINAMCTIPRFYLNSYFEEELS